MGLAWGSADLSGADGYPGWQKQEAELEHAWTIRIGSRLLDEGREAAQHLGLSAAACGERVVMLAPTGGARIGVPTVNTVIVQVAVDAPAAVVRHRPDECLARDAVEAAATKYNRELRLRLGLADFYLPTPLTP